MLIKGCCALILLINFACLHSITDHRLDKPTFSLMQLMLEQSETLKIFMIARFMQLSSIRTSCLVGKVASTAYNSNSKQYARNSSTLTNSDLEFALFERIALNDL